MPANSHLSPSQEKVRPPHTQQSTPLLAYPQLHPRAPDKSNSVTSFPLTETSITGLPHQYPDFYNERQNGVAQKYWRKRRLKQSLMRANKELRGYDSDVASHSLAQDAATNGRMDISKSGVTSREAGDTRVGPPMSRAEHNEIAPIVGLSSPPSAIMADSESFLETSNVSKLSFGVQSPSLAAATDSNTVATSCTTSFICQPQSVQRSLLHTGKTTPS